MGQDPVQRNVGEGTPFFDLLAQSARDVLISAGRQRRLPSGRLVIVEGDESRDVVVVLEGHLKIEMAGPNGRDFVLDVVGPGVLLGELGFLDGEPRAASAVTMEPVCLLVVGNPAFDDFLAVHPEAQRAFYAVLAARLRHADQRSLELATTDALGRVCARLVELAHAEAEGVNCAVLRMPLTQTDLASWTGLSREAVVKALRTLRRLGWIDNRGAELEIHDLVSLRIRCGG